jgi:general transcription factor 3C polypeptide 4
MSPVSGITYIKQENAAIVVLFDGSFHVIYNLFTDPSWTPPSLHGQFTSGKLSAVSRSVFSRAEQGIIQKADVNRITGMTLYDSFGTIAWLHEYVS